MATAPLPFPGLRFGLYPQKANQPRKYFSSAATLLKAAAWKKGNSQQWQAFAQNIKCDEEKYQSLTLSQVQQALNRLKLQIAQQGLGDQLLMSAFLLVGEVIYRATGFRLFQSQIYAARIILGDAVAEMQTGEGKTLATSLAALISALAGIPTQVLTANEYLVKRDAEQLDLIAGTLGLTVGYIVNAMTAEERRQQYNCNITYCTGSELAFDYLKDSQTLTQSTSPLHFRLQQITTDHHQQPLLPGLCFAIVDEADNVLLDEASTPLILAQQAEDEEMRAVCQQAFALAETLKIVSHYARDPTYYMLYLTSAGKLQLEYAAAGMAEIWRNKPFREEKVQQALTASLLFKRDQDYLVQDGKIELIDSNSGRIAEGRKWSHGLHAMLEYKEACEFSGTQRTLARTSFQRLFPRYHKLGGTSATLQTAAGELQRVYQLSVISVPLNRPSQRQNLGFRLFADKSTKWQYVLGRVKSLHQSGRPVLIGTDSVADSEALFKLLLAHRLGALLLNAKTHSAEAEIIQHAGTTSAITVSTNMAGRGTDIKLDANATRLGGLHVINCQFNHSARLDLQILGRCARQGDPGSYETVLSCEDAPLLKATQSKLLRAILKFLGKLQKTDSVLARYFIKHIQKQMENKSARQRARLSKKELRMEKLLAGFRDA